MIYRRVQMHERVFLGLLSLLGLSLQVYAPDLAHADQRRDYMLNGLPAGDRLILDYLGTGGRVTLEHKRTLFGGANDYSFSTSALLGYPLGQAEASAAMRVLWFEIGATLGYRVVWRNLQFEPGDGTYCSECDRPARRRRDGLFDSGSGIDHFGFAEGRIQLYAPLNDYFVFTSLFAMRYETLRPRSYDWFFTNVHDPGWMTRLELIGLAKHRRWGGIGPYIMYISVPRGGHQESEVAFGFNAMTRLGLVDRNDMLFVTFLVRPGDGMYGVHSYYAPVRALVVYRMTLSL